MNKNKITEKYLPLRENVSIFDNLILYEVSSDEILDVCVGLYRGHNLPLKTITVFDERESGGLFKIMYVFGIPKDNVFIAPYIMVKDEFPSLACLINEAFLYERKIKTFFGLEPKGHPDPRPLILHDNWPEDVFPLRKDFDWNTRPTMVNKKYDFNKVEGEGIYEIPVGPVHAGIIEPGHFRFSVLGEEIILLEPRLGYSHKGSEKLFEVLSLENKIKLSERISGDSSFSHSLAFCQALEKIAGITLPEKAKYLRVIFAELERIANHFGDIGAIMTDTGFNFGGANGGRLREMVMQINDHLTGSRFLRGVNILGGVSKDIKEDDKKYLLEKMKDLKKDFSEVIDVAENSASLLDRLKTTGRMDYDVACDFGVVGVAGRAVGLTKDARIDHPYAGYDELSFEIALEKAGDVHARFNVRVKEVYSSIDLIENALEKITDGGDIKTSSSSNFKKNFYCVSVVEGWRGDIVYIVSTNSKGEINRVDVRDPSFLNWPALGCVGKGNIVPDFPLINKSFNLSYTGNDL